MANTCTHLNTVADVTPSSDGCEAVACRFGELSQQPTCPQRMQPTGGYIAIIH